MAVSSLTDAQLKQVVKLYLAYFNRAPETSGLDFHVSEILKALNASPPKTFDQALTARADQFFEAAVAVPQFSGYSISQPVSDFVKTMYANVLLRPTGGGAGGPAPSDSDVSFWVNKIVSGQITRGQLVTEFLKAVDNLKANGTDAEKAIANQVDTVINNRLTVALEFAKPENSGSLTGEAAFNAGKAILDGVDATAASVTAALAKLDANVGTTFNLTTGVDNIDGSALNDTVNALLGAGATLNPLDNIDGAGGNGDTINIFDVTGGQSIPGGVTVTGFEHAVAQSAGVVGPLDVSTWSGLQDLAVTQGTGAEVIAAATTNVAASGLTGNIIIDGGKDVSVTDATAVNSITVGQTTSVAGKVTINSTKSDIAQIYVDGGTDVTVNESGTTLGGLIQIGQGGAASDLPTGVVSVTSAHVAGASASLANITVTGGSQVTVKQTVDASKAASDTTADSVSQGFVSVTGGSSTTSVTISQAEAVAAVSAVSAVAGVTETASVKFSALTVGQTLILGGLTFTAAAAMTANEAAAAFANLIASDTQSGGAASKGTYTGTLSGWTSGAASGDTVVFTSTTANANVGNLANSGTGTATITTTAGSAATAAVTGVLGVNTNGVSVDGNIAGTDVLATVKLDGYLVGDVKSDALTALDLANSTGGLTVTNSAATSLALGLNKLGAGSSLNLGSTYTALNVTTSVADSDVDLTAGGVTALKIAGDHAVDLTGASLGALKTVTVTGSAGLKLDASGATVTAVDTSGTTGKSTITIDGSKATYTGGTGVDAVTLSSATVSKAVSLGGGSDTLTLAAGAPTATAVLDGGDGSDVLAAAVADAATFSATATFEGQIQNFEKLSLGSAAADATVNLANVDDINYVISAGTAAGKTLTLNNFGASGTLELTDNNAGTGIVAALADATGSSDVFNLVLKSSGNLTGGVLNVASVETVNVSIVDTQTTNPTKNVDTLTVTADKATSVNVTGTGDLTLSLAGSTKVTSIDASGLTGALTATSLNTTSATTIKGGTGNDVLTAATGTTADVLIGGSGDDRLTGNAGLTTMTGGAGNDLFVVNTASANVNSYGTIADFSAGDLVQFTGATSFSNAKVTLGDTAVFQDYANAAINAVAANGAGWFQFGGNTYVVFDAGANSTTFVEGTDYIVKLTGLVDLTNASLNTTSGTIGL